MSAPAGLPRWNSDNTMVRKLTPGSKSPGTRVIFEPYSTGRTIFNRGVSGKGKSLSRPASVG